MQGRQIERLASGRGDHLEIADRPVFLDEEDQSRAPLRVTQIRGNRPVSFDTLEDQARVFAQRESLRIEEAAPFRANGRPFVLEDLGLRLSRRSLGRWSSFWNFRGACILSRLRHLLGYLSWLLVLRRR